MLIVKPKGVIDNNYKSLYSLIDKLIFKYDEKQVKIKVWEVHWLQFGVWMQVWLLIKKIKFFKKILNLLLLKVD